MEPRWAITRRKNHLPWLSSGKRRLPNGVQTIEEGRRIRRASSFACGLGLRNGETVAAALRPAIILGPSHLKQFDGKARLGY
jgi:hypothetical protein